MTTKIDSLLIKTALTLILLSVGNNAIAQIMPRVIGGKSASLPEWPWMSGLVSKRTSSLNGTFCGATLVAKRWVLTAAHCVTETHEETVPDTDPAETIVTVTPVSTSSFDVIINHAKLSSSSRGERLTVAEVIIHPEYNSETLENDLALVRLRTASQFLPIKLLSPFTSQDAPGQTGIALGWGTQDPDTTLTPNILQQVDLPIVSQDTCSESMEEIKDGMLCAGTGIGGKDTCFGDSGGPLIVFDSESKSWRQAGITSWGFGCALPDTYGVYTRVQDYATFISDTICNANEIPAPVTLNLSIDNQTVSSNWNSSSTAAVSGYRLNFAPYPEAETIQSIELNQLTALSATLEPGFAYYIAITSYKDNCLSSFSNIEELIIK
ncbi:MAG: prostasin [Methyloprofundus sp.]|nr:MAG: prostasin [Methyloprofundus sp.]